MKWADFLYADRNLGKLNVKLKAIGWEDYAQKYALKSSLSYKSFDECTRFVEWFWHANSDWIIFCLTTNMLCIFDICWVSTAPVLINNDVLLVVSTGKVLKLGFSKCF